jgi:hypothetical protein
MLRNRAENALARRIKQLASLWAGCAQSYPQEPWKQVKAAENHALGVIPSKPLEVRPLTAIAGQLV